MRKFADSWPGKVCGGLWRGRRSPTVIVLLAVWADRLRGVLAHGVAQRRPGRRRYASTARVAVLFWGTRRRPSSYGVGRSADGPGRSAASPSSSTCHGLRPHARLVKSAAAPRRRSEQVRLGTVGLYAFTALWVVDVCWWWLDRDGYDSREVWLDRDSCVHGFHRVQRNGRIRARFHSLDWSGASLWHSGSF